MLAFNPACWYQNVGALDGAGDGENVPEANSAGVERLKRGKKREKKEEKKMAQGVGVACWGQRVKVSVLGSACGGSACGRAQGRRSAFSQTPAPPHTLTELALADQVARRGAAGFEASNPGGVVVALLGDDIIPGVAAREALLGAVRRAIAAVRTGLHEGRAVAAGLTVIPEPV